MSIAAKAEKPHRLEAASNTPIAVEAVEVFNKIFLPAPLLHQKAELVHLGNRLMEQARDVRVPLDREAFVAKGPGVRIVDLQDGSGKILDWCFLAAMRVGKQEVTVNVQKINAWNGRGASVRLFLSQGDVSLDLWATPGRSRPDTYSVELMERGVLEEYAVFERQQGLLFKKPLTIVRSG